jgi:hypothetical protein
MNNGYKEIELIDASTYAGKAALACKTKARGIMGDDLLIFKLLDFVSFMVLHNKFASRGIFITDNNKEECYIKIIESGHDDLIVDLEKYIIYLDNIKDIEKYRNEYQSIINNLQVLEDYNDEIKVNSIVEEYLRR